jgi:hypothetical protein
MPHRVRPSFVRFVVASIDEDSHRELGVFQAADSLLEKHDLPVHDAELISEILGWFNVNLEKPRRFTASKPPHYRKQSKAISWFKSSARSHIDMLRNLNAILEIHGATVRMIKTARPGYIVYEDEFQVVAEPFADAKF